ncbi:MipA/OmpV family protein [Stutzerimonas nitrititolerans]|uniref:MipA/OmpV family protein n=1 Tax=Stutzerimonas nitrititolerans TaxID=2482751 RepID=UPI0028B14059|nr:MipA/OmpV family protein [Stutzerimonas nitrititolerans]
MKYRRLVLLAFTLPLAAQAGESGFQSIGIGLSASQAIYAGEDRSVSLLPLLHYESERFFVRGLTGGVHLYEVDGFGLDAIVAGRFDGIDADDFGRDELLRNGIDRDLLEDRDNGVDLGLRATWMGVAGELQATARGDVSGASDGYELSLEYGYPFSVAGAEVTPSLTMSYLSDKLADYYYGTLSKEEARGVSRYRPGNAFVPGVALGVSKPLGERWLLNAEASYQKLPGRITDSPLTEGESNVFGFKVGLSWVFD